MKPPTERNPPSGVLAIDGDEYERWIPDDIDDPVVDPSSPAPWRSPRWFVVAEVLLILSVPVLAVLGVRELLGSTSGTFLSDPLEGEPGWSAVVEPSPVVAVAEVLDDQVTGYALITRPGDDADGGAVLLISPETVLDDGRRLDQLPVAEALPALAGELRLQFTATHVVTDWNPVLGEASLSIDNPDPLPSSAGSPAIDVGPIDIDAAGSNYYLGTHRDDADPRSLLFRRQLWWEAALGSDLDGRDELFGVIDAVGSGNWRVEVLPVEDGAAGLVFRLDQVEALVNEVIPLPAGAEPGDRTQIRIVDRSGTIDTRALAVEVGRRGFEVSAIANAAEFDDGPTQLIVPAAVDPVDVRDLANELGADTVTPDPIDDAGDQIVVLLAGSDLELG